MAVDQPLAFTIQYADSITYLLSPKRHPHPGCPFGRPKTEPKVTDYDQLLKFEDDIDVIIEKR
ncbi:MAG: hypothetical protein M1354_00005 [Candidatus Marsarchaeota archaeon]|jgi:hypothetical protein|nr:hypothetical protein [Candidatus Marsarchaeota archaeon]